MIPKHWGTDAQRKNNNIWHCIKFQIIVILYFKMLSAALSELALSCSFF